MPGRTFDDVFRAAAAIAEIVVKEKANGGQKSLTVYAYCS